MSSNDSFSLSHTHSLKNHSGAIAKNSQTKSIARSTVTGKRKRKRFSYERMLNMAETGTSSARRWKREHPKQFPFIITSSSKRRTQKRRTLQMSPPTIHFGQRKRKSPSRKPTESMVTIGTRWPNSWKAVQQRYVRENCALSKSVNRR